MALSYLDMLDPNFSTKGKEVLAARSTHWCAKTPFGLAVLRHQEAGLLLRDRRLRQGSYAWPNRMSLKGEFANFWQRSIISQEGPIHRLMRNILVPSLSEEFVRSLVPSFNRSAEELVSNFDQSSTCEFMADFSVPFAGRAICALLGLPKTEWQFVSDNASALGLAMGLECKTYEATFNLACTKLMELAGTLVDQARADQSDGFVSQLVARFDAQSDLSEQVLLDLIVITIFGGVDTTRGQLAFLMALFAQSPDQWNLLVARPELASAAVEEAIRLWPTTTWATREVLENFSFDGVQFEEGTTVHFFVHSAATDPAIHSGDGLNLTAKRKIHFGFGGGVHHCVGHYMARTDMVAALTVLAKKFAKVEFSGDPEFLPDSGNTSPVCLPLKFEVA